MRAALRSRLMPLHEALDRDVASLCFAGPSPRLGRLLAVHANVFPVLEAALARDGVAALYPGWDRPSRLAALAADIAALGAPPPFPGLTPPPLPAPTDAAAITGTLYVLEGSRLGNRALLRHVADGAPAAFLRHGIEDGAWLRFAAWLKRQDLAGDRFEAAVAAGGRTFALYAATVAAATAQQAEAARPPRASVTAPA